MSICKEKDVLNEVSVLSNKPTEFAAVAKTDVELVLVEQKDILAVVNSGPSWISNIFKTLCERLIATNEIIVEHNLKSGSQDPETILSNEEELFHSKALREYQTK
jgi:CRP-like cAMP-binding protein